ncbi:MAG: sodium:proton antiporter [Deltaproteobacteria bacterium]|nr:sodium:proton antiporter [Deltaproteobacteria bacterium]
MSILEIIGSVFLLSGTLVCIIGGIGIVRFPNFFARIHAASVPDTLGAGLCLLGMVVLTCGLSPEQGYDAKLIALIIVKLVSIGIFIFVTSPISGHALAKSAYRDGLGVEPEDDAKSQTQEGAS